MPWYEKEDLEKAREMTAIEYLKRYEPQRLKPCRGLRHEYELTDHDSFKINEITSQWHWKSRDIGGISALNFLVHVNGMSFLDAVGFLLEQNPYCRSRARTNFRSEWKSVSWKRGCIISWASAG